MPPSPRLLASVLASLLCLAPQAFAAKSRDSMIETSTHVRIHAIDAGPQTDKPALVLVPGWGFAGSVWAAQIDAFAGNRRVIAIDPRSQGDSTKIAEGDTPEQRARDLREVLDHFRLKSIVLVGWSQGVQDVAAFVDQFGTDRLKGIVLVDSPVSAGHAAIAAAPQAAAEQFEMFAFYAEHPREYLGGMMQAIIQRKLDAAETHRLVEQALKTPPAIGLSMLVTDFFGKDRTPALAKFDRPTLVVAAGASPELDEQKAMAKKLPHGRIEIVADARHALFIDQPEKFNALLADFLTTIH